MEDLEMLSPDYLMARAEQCRRLASRAYSSEIGEELEKLARDKNVTILSAASA